MSNYIPKPSIFDPDEKGQFGFDFSAGGGDGGVRFDHRQGG